MKTIEFGIEVIDENCTGCYRCEQVCPTEAIVMVGPRTEALAVVDNDRCIACMRCIDACDDDALLTIDREPTENEIDTSTVDPEVVKRICQSADIAPDDLACPCANTTAQEVAAVIAQGAGTYEELSLRLGVQSGCLIYCSVPLRRLLKAGTGEARTHSKFRRYNSDQSLMDIDPSLDARYPLFKLGTEQRWRATESAEIEVDL